MVNYRNYKDQDYKDIKAECAKNGKLFEDPEFPASNSSLYFSQQPPFNAVWKRPKEISANASLFIEGASSADVAQGRIGNCWFVAAAAALALEKDLWTKVIPDYKTQGFDEDYQGIFRFRFWRFGEWIEVVVDDKLPTINGELIYVKSKERGEFWSALLEKAYAKLAGSYEGLDAGNPSDALVDFTGGIGETIDMVRNNYATEIEKRKELHVKLKKLLDRKSLASASIKIASQEEMEQQLDTGLVKGHAYGISAVKTIKLGDGFFSRFNAEKLYMVKLRNPWGKKEWNGAWSDGSDDWERLSKDERENLDIKVEDDGEFWMSWEDFCKHFTTINLCVLVNTSVFSLHTTYNEGALFGKWDVGSSAGGCVNNKESFLRNPQYRFDMTGNGKDVAFVSLMQPDTRNLKSQGKKNLTMGFYVMKVETNRIYRAHSRFDKAGDSAFVNSREVFAHLELDPGRYFIIPSTFQPNIAGNFLVRVYTDHSNHMSELRINKPEATCLSCLPIFKYPTHQASIVVTTVTGLVRKGASLTVDPYCVIECEGTKVTTAKHDDALNPQFNEGAVFYIKNFGSAVLKIQVWDNNALIPDTFLGEIQFPLQVNNKVQKFTKELIKSKSKDGIEVKADGKIEFKYAVSDRLDLM